MSIQAAAYFPLLRGFFCSLGVQKVIDLKENNFLVATQVYKYKCTKER
jgi:hypothetical protein